MQNLPSTMFPVLPVVRCVPISRERWETLWEDGGYATLDMVWSLADVTMALMAICNLIAILFLGKYAIRLLNDYRAQKKAGIQSPVFKKETMPDIEKDLECW